MTTTRPYYRRRIPHPTLKVDQVLGDGRYIDWSWLTPLGYSDPDPVATADAQRDNRAAAVIAAAVAIKKLDPDGTVALTDRTKIRWVPGEGGARVEGPLYTADTLLEYRPTKEFQGLWLMRGKCLAVMLYQDYFPGDQQWHTLRTFVSEKAAAVADPGYCGTFGPKITGTISLILEQDEGNYDMGQMNLLPIAYAFFDELSPKAQYNLVVKALAGGLIARPNRKTLFTSGAVPDDWSRAGYISPTGLVHKDIGETENHILMIATVRYLANQLLYQLDHAKVHDNRRNATDDSPSSYDLVLTLLRNFIRGEFSEYNGKNYQEHTRQALLNLYSYAYDHEIRLAARMVLDYVSARMAVSSSDLRRLLPFRRRNEPPKINRTADGYMTVGLLQGEGADPMGPYFALQTGNVRSCVVPAALSGLDHPVYGLALNAQDLVVEVITDYRIPPSIHDLFVNDSHRRFYQRLRRFPRNDVGGGRKFDNSEIQAGSPSYVITAGGQADTYAIDPYIDDINYTIAQTRQQLGVAVTTSFIPTTGFGGRAMLLDQAEQHIQFSAFSMRKPGHPVKPSAFNYGVAPDFACGHQARFPSWVVFSRSTGSWRFADFGSTADRPGFYLAVFTEPDGVVLEAYDTWLRPGLSFDAFCAGVPGRNPMLSVRSGETSRYVTTLGTDIVFRIWKNSEHFATTFGAHVDSVTYGVLAADRIGDAGNVRDRKHNGTIINSRGESIIEIGNPALNTVIRLDLSDIARPRRTAEDGSVESAGSSEEVWADFDWAGPSEGDAARPYASVVTAVNAVASGGTIRLIPSSSSERVRIGVGKRFRMVAPIGGVTIG